MFLGGPVTGIRRSLRGRAAVRMSEARTRTTSDDDDDDDDDCEYETEMRMTREETG